MFQSAEIKKIDRLGSLDGVRGLAALVVAIVFHYRSFYTWGSQPDPAWFSNPVLWPFLTLGQFAVDVFFVVSGIVFCHVYYDQISSRRISGKRFFMLRFARLYPLHLVTTLFMGFLIWGSVIIFGRFPLSNLIDASDSYHLLLNLLMLQSVGIQFSHSFNFVAWSLSVEVICYCIFFCIARLASLFELCCFALAIFGIYLLFNRIDTVFLSPSIGRGLFGFFAGCLVARGVNNGLSTPLAIATSGLVAFFALTLAYPKVMVHASEPYFAMQTTVLPSVVVMTLTVPPLRWLLSTWLPRKLGDLSYSVYMVHISVQSLIFIASFVINRPVPYDRWWFYAIYVALVLLVAEIAHRSIEIPAQRWIRARYSALQ